MCGLFGAFSSVLTPNEKKVVQSMAYFSSVRGVDSTGMVYISNRGNKVEPLIHKATVNPVTYMNLPEVEEGILNQPLRLIIGHNRAATIGSINYANSQPIFDGGIFGTHNGTISTMGDYKSDISDSRMLYSMISRCGIERTLREVEAKGHPSYALVWYDSEERTLNMVRNDRRPL